VTPNLPANATSVAVSDSFGGDGYYKQASNSGTAKILYYTGEAYDAGVTATLPLLPQIGPLTLNDTGAIQTSQATTAGPGGLNLGLGPIGLNLLNAGVGVTTGNGTSSSTATITTASAGVLLLIPSISATAVKATSTSTCAGSTGSTTIASLSIGGHVVIGPGSSIPVNPAPSTKVTVGNVTVILNGQTPVPGADHGLTTNAIEVKVPGLLDLVLASARSDIHNCV
jgi:hypothetical protein